MSRSIYLLICPVYNCRLPWHWLAGRGWFVVCVCGQTNNAGVPPPHWAKLFRAGSPAAMNFDSGMDSWFGQKMLCPPKVNRSHMPTCMPDWQENDKLTGLYPLSRIAGNENPMPHLLQFYFLTYLVKLQYNWGHSQGPERIPWRSSHEPSAGWWPWWGTWLHPWHPWSSPLELHWRSSRTRTQDHYKSKHQYILLLCFIHEKI